MPTSNTNYLRRLGPCLLIVGLWLLFFWPMITGETVAGYRDSSYLYYPMLQWIDRQIESGHFPLWMPLDNAGFPLLADGTSSMLYPGKLVFHLRFLPFASRYGIYLAMHILLAAFGALWLTRALGAGRWGACLAAISYAFGGSLLFQVCNVIYLVSGAWLPIALTCVWKMLSPLPVAGPIQSRRTLQPHLLPSRENTWAIAGGFCCCMMILGGDPQMVYHIGLIALLTILFSTARYQRLKVLIALVIATSGLAAAQLIPTIQWASHSARMATSTYSTPVNLREAILSDHPIENLGNLASVPDGSPLTDVYQFSQEPWTALECLWSGLFGKDAPVNTRWTAAFPGAERVWMPSIYFGTIPFVLAFSGLRFWKWRNGKRQQGREAKVWLTWIAVWFSLASCGWYGPVWLAKELGFYPEAQLHQGSFGLYWTMVILLPKYALFRYPAKLAVIALLALCVLAGLQLRPRTIVRTARWWKFIAALSIAGASIMFWPGLQTQLARCQSSGLYGPFQAITCSREILLSFCKTTILCSAMIGIAVVTRAAIQSHSARRTFRIACALIMVLVAVDLSISNRWMLHPVPASVVAGESAIAGKLKQDRAAAGIDPNEILTINRTNPQVDFDPQWLETSSPDRISRIAQWRRETLFPKTHLDIANVQIHGSFCSIMPSAYQEELTSAAPSAATDGLIVPQPPGAALVWNATPAPLAWVEDSPADQTHQAKSANAPVPPEDSTRFASVQWRNNQLVIAVPPDTEKTRVLVVRLLAVPGWQASAFDTNGTALTATVMGVSKTSSPIHSKVALPRGTVQIKLTYQPVGFYIGLAISGISFLICGSLLLLCLSTRRNENRASWKL